MKHEVKNDDSLIRVIDKIQGYVFSGMAVVFVTAAILNCNGFDLFIATICAVVSAASFMDLEKKEDE